MRRFAVAAGALALAVVAFVLYWRLRPSPLPPPPSETELRALAERRDALQARLGEVVVEAGEKSLSTAPPGDVMIGIPTSFTRSIVQEVVTGLFDGMTLTLKNLKVHKEGDVKVKMLVRRKRVGHYVLDVQIHEVKGVLKPGRPDLQFSSGRVAVTLPVRLAAGTGNAEIRLRWDSKGLVANTVCGDTDVTKAVTGGVVPQDYVLKGAFRIAGAGEAIVLSPDFREELQVRIFVDPTEQAWQAVEEVVKAQRAGCEAALNKIDIKEILAHIVGRGFGVKIPQKVIKPVRIPAGIRRSLEMQGIRVALDVKPTGLKVAADRLWYGANVGLELKKAVSSP
jgi:hypothetical protein